MAVRATGGRERVSCLRTGLVLAVLLVASLSGCGDGDDGGPAATVTSTSSTAPTSTTTESPTVTTASTDLGEVLVDGSGFTLYRFTADEAGASNCADGCAEVWLPVIPEGALVVGDDLDPTHFGTVTRPDGTVQLTVDQLPLYRFSGDIEAGQVNGQGAGGQWFAVTPEGDLVGPESGSEPPAGADGTTTTITIPPIGY